MSDFLKHALALAGYGYRVFPLEVNGKRPALKTSWKTLATTDPKKIGSLWTDWRTGEILNYNIGIATGDGLVVVDVDVKDDDDVTLDQRVAVLEIMFEDLPETYTVETANGGRHYYFNTDTPVGNSVQRLGTGIDIRGVGGYVVAEGSWIGDKRYARGRASQDQRAECPRSIVEQILERSHPQRIQGDNRVLLGWGKPAGIDEDTAERRALSYLARREPALEGAGGDEHTFATVAAIKDFGVAEDRAPDVLAEWNSRCEPPWQPEDLAIKIRNAYRYGQNPVGIAAPEAEFEPVEVVDRRTKPAKGKLYYERWRNVGFSTDSVSLIDGWYDRGAMVVTYGESGSGKTHIVLSQAVAIATGEKWCESETSAGLVVYVAAEGGRGIRKRIAAWRRKMGDADIPVALVPCPVDLMRPTGDTNALIGLIKAAEADFGCKAVMVVIDTASRAMAGGNENAPDDMGAFVMHCDRIRDATKTTLHVIHHSGKNKAAGARGHSLLRAATDTEIEVSEGKVTATKQRDMDTPKAINFTLQGVDLGADDKGRRVTTALPVLAIESEFEEKVSEGQERQFESLWALIGAKTGSDEVDAICAAEANMSDWKAAHGIPRGDRSGAAKEFERNADALVRAGRITISESGRGKSTVFKVNRTFAESRQKSATN